MKDLRDWVDIAFKVVLAVTGIIVGYYFSFQKQQNDDIKLIVDMTTSGDKARSLMGASIARAYLTQKRIPDEVYAAVFSYANNSDDPKLRAVVNAGAASVFKEQPSARSALLNAADALPVRIYFHIRDGNDRSAAEDLGRKIAASAAPAGSSIVIPGVQLIAGTQTKSLLKCFKKAECQTLGPKLVELFAGNNVTLELANQSDTYEGSDAIRPNHFEAWFAPGLRDNPVLAGIAVPSAAPIRR